MYKIIAIDLDGTLLNNQKTISEENIKALQFAQTKGAMIVLATGRPLSGIKKYLNQLNLKKNTFAICFNGGLVTNIEETDIIKEKILTGKDAKEIYHLSKKLGVNIHAFRGDGSCISPKNSRYTTHEVTLNELPLNIIPFEVLDDNEEIIKVMLVDEPDILSVAISKISPYYKKKYNVVQSAPFFLEFLNKQTDKWFGLVSLAKYLKIDTTDIMTFGDSENDLVMVKNAGLGIAMANATSDVKCAAKYITDSNEENGIASAIYKFLHD